MSVGLETRNSINRFLLLADKSNYVFHSKGSIATSTPTSTDYAESVAQFVDSSLPSGGFFAFICNSKIVARNTIFFSDKGFNLSCKGGVGTTITWYYFVPAYKLPVRTSGCGLQILNSDGTLGYDSMYALFKPVVTLSSNHGAGYHWLFCGWTADGVLTTSVDADLDPIILPAGKTYALMIGPFGNNRVGAQVSGPLFKSDIIGIGGLCNGTNVVTLGSYRARNAGNTTSTYANHYAGMSHWTLTVVDVTGL